MDKVCTKCKVLKDYSAFGKCAKTYDGLNAWCRECFSAQYYKNHEHNLLKSKRNYQKNKDKKKIYDKQYNIINREKVSKRKKFQHLKARYNLSEDQYNQLIASQGGRCYICNDLTRLAVDHCHRTGKVRKLLCYPCNKGLGNFKENLDSMQNAIVYLKFHNFKE